MKLVIGMTVLTDMDLVVDPTYQQVITNPAHPHGDGIQKPKSKLIHSNQLPAGGFDAHLDLVGKSCVLAHVRQMVGAGASVCLNHRFFFPLSFPS